MKYTFNAYGHQNIRATHKTTLEFTKDKEVSLKGDCIVGVKADFDLGKIKDFIKKAQNRKITITIEAPGKNIKETVNAELNPGFNSGREMVIRKTDFASERTFAVKADKAALELNRGFVGHMKGEKITIDAE